MCRSGLGIPQEDPEFVSVDVLLQDRAAKNAELLAGVKADRHAAELYEAAVNDAMNGRMTWPQEVSRVSMNVYLRGASRGASVVCGNIHICGAGVLRYRDTVATIRRGAR